MNNSVKNQKLPVLKCIYFVIELRWILIAFSSRAMSHLVVHYESSKNVTSTEPTKFKET